MGFSVVEGEGRTLWCCTDGSSTYYLGQIVSLVTDTKAMINGAVVPLPVPHGAADTTHFAIPFGVVVGFNDRTPTYTSVGSLKIQYATGVVTSANQVTRIGTGITGGSGMYGQDPQLLVQVAEITPNTVLKGPFYNAAYGTAISELTHTSVADTTGMATAAATLDACNFTPVTLLATIYCREGKNRGLYRTTVDTSTTIPDLTTAFPYNSTIGDKYVRVPAKQGLSYIYIGGPGLYIDASLGLATNYFTVICYKLDLAISGQESMEFRFSTVHFDNARA
jgi:hypothetical protein